MDDSTIQDWKESAADCVRTHLFPKKQFLASDAELDMGGSIQRHVTKHINLANQTRMRIFWDERGGRETVRNTFRRKRQTAQNAMKMAFKGKKGKLQWSDCYIGFSNQYTNALCSDQIGSGRSRKGPKTTTKNPQIQRRLLLLCETTTKYTVNSRIIWSVLCTGSVGTP
jgi:hypothetical protein